MLNFFWNFFTFIITMGILVTIHEYGHFCVARYFGVSITSFSIGFGRSLWHRYDKYGTEYIIAIIPFGGYVKMLDERIDIVSPERRRETFNIKNLWQRTAIIIAGPIFNFIFSVIIYWLVFMIGIPSYRPIINDIAPNSIISQANISPGMEIKSVEGIRTPDWNEVRLQLYDRLKNNEVRINVSSLESPFIEEKVLHLNGYDFSPDKQDPIIALGIIPKSPYIVPVLTKVQTGSSAEKAGLKINDRIINVDSQIIDNWQLFIKKIRKNPGKTLNIVIKRKNKEMNLTLTPDIKSIKNGKIEGFAGLTPKIIPIPEKYKILLQYRPLHALKKSIEKIFKLTFITINMLGKLITGNVSLNSLRGPISIAQYAGISATYGLVYYLMFLALISINVGVINLFPLPILDGGHLIFLAIEKFKNKPLSEQVQNLSYRFSAILLTILMLLIIFNDLSNLK